MSWLRVMDQRCTIVVGGTEIGIPSAERVPLCEARFCHPPKAIRRTHPFCGPAPFVVGIDSRTGVEDLSDVGLLAVRRREEVEKLAVHDIVGHETEIEPI